MAGGFRDLFAFLLGWKSSIPPVEVDVYRVIVYINRDAECILNIDQTKEQVLYRL